MDRETDFTTHPEGVADAAATIQPLRGEQVVRLGMPELAYGGLSETWLLKHLGDSHWRLLAGMAGHDTPRFRDHDGAPVYAAFRAASLRDMALDAVAEHDDLAVTSAMARITRTQFVSRHILRCEERAIGAVELCSVFIRRQGTGRGNHAIARVALPGFPPPERREGFDEAAALAARMAGNAWGAHFGFAAADATPLHSYEADPCPAQDFNGAGLLYFASFLSFVDRMEWACLAPDPRLVTRARDVVFFGNADPGERLRLDAVGLRRAGDTLAHRCRITRQDDGARMAEVFTRKSPAR